MNYLTSEDGKSINTTNPLPVVAKLSGSNTEETNGANIATKSNLVAGESPTGKQRPLNVDEDGKLQVGGITTVGIDQTTPGTTNKVVAELSGSNTRKWATDTITFGAGAGAHNAGDVLSTDTGEILEFDVSAWIAAGGSGIILSSLVTLNQAPFAGGAGYTLHLFTAAPTVIADNAAWVLVAAELATYIGPIDISVMKTGTNASYALDIGHNLDFTLASGSTKLYGQLVCKGTDTTVNTKVMTVNLGIAAL